MSLPRLVSVGCHGDCRHSITWTTILGRKQVVIVEGRATMGEAAMDVVLLAISVGWTPPRCWQWWRKSDTKLEELVG